MKHLITAALCLSLLMGLSASTTDYLDLSIDPVVDGGLNSAQITAYQELGYELYSLESDGFFEDVSFKNASGIYTQSGWIAAGETCLFSESYGETVFVTGGNKTHTMPTKETIDQEKEN